MKQAYLQSRLKSKKLPIFQNSWEMFSVILLNIPCKNMCVREKIRRTVDPGGFFPCFPNGSSFGTGAVGSWWHPCGLCCGLGDRTSFLSSLGKVCCRICVWWVCNSVNHPLLWVTVPLDRIKIMALHNWVSPLVLLCSPMARLPLWMILDFCCKAEWVLLLLKVAFVLILIRQGDAFQYRPLKYCWEDDCN